MTRIVFTALCYFTLTALGLAHDGVHDEWYRSLGVPNTPFGQFHSCCDQADCKPVQARIKPDGHWEVWIDEKTFPDDPMSSAHGHAPNAWVTVPNPAILNGQTNPIGEPVACWYAGAVLCFVPGTQV